MWFEFGIAGVTRAFSHQFVRHHMGISFEQQSQRYVTFKGGEFPYTVPESVKRAGLEHEYAEEFDRVAGLYDRLCRPACRRRTRASSSPMRPTPTSRSR